MKVWSDDIALFVGIARATPDKYDKAQAGTREMAAYFRCLVAERRKAPREDMISALIAAEEHAQHLTEDEIVATCILLLFAGHETTANLIGNGVLALLRHPAELAKLRARPELAEGAVEECLRYDGPSGALARVVAVGHEMGGRQLKTGERVYAWMNAANRDPRRFPDPDRFDIAPRQSPPHLRAWRPLLPGRAARASRGADRVSAIVRTAAGVGADD